MVHRLPSIPILRFTPEVFINVITAYALCAGKRNPCNRLIDPMREFTSNIVELSDGHSYREWRLGSSITRNTKLFLHSVRKSDGIHVAFDLNPNTFDDSRKEAVAMRKKFHREVCKYLASL